MKIKDIVNRDIANLTNCDHEPIHVPGTIQPHGFLLAVDKKTFQIRFCSENSMEFIGFTHLQLLGKNLKDIFGSACYEELQKIENFTNGQFKIFKFLFGGKELEFVAHHFDNNIIIESETAHNILDEVTDMFALSKQFIGYMEDSHTLIELCGLVADSVKKITGYDRVMIYKFDAEYNGEVIAESKNINLDAFLGLHYPHTDIPTQARELYIKNLLRIIVDVNYKPVPLFTIDDESSKNLDLSHSVLRSVSPIHIQYLHNIGIGATLTISLLHKGKLWGLIACHHYSPKYLSHTARLAAKLQGHFITSQIEVRESNERYEISKKAHDAADEIISKQFDIRRSSLVDIVSDQNTLELCKATGVSMSIGEKIYKNGFTPGDKDIKQLAAYLSVHTKNTKFHTSSLSKDLPELKDIALNTPGLNYYALDKSSNNCIIWYKPETISEVHWAGDPNKAIEKDKNGLSPRKSFDLWSQKVKDQSNAWKDAELVTSSNFANFMHKHLGFIYLAEEEEKQRQVSEKLKETNSELENINWISTHDLQEPLRKIQVATSFIMTEEAKDVSESVLQKLGRINKSAGRMQTLINDILHYTRLKEGEQDLIDVDLNILIKEVLDELQDVMKEKNAEVKLEELPVIKGIPFLLKQLFSNLMYNALKFSSVDRIPEITISTFDYHLQPSKIHPPKEYYIIKFSDNGIGFSPEFNETIFKIFTRLHVAGKFPGSGIGLALCKKIMEKHNGIIRVEGIVNTGATFYIYFPKSN